MPEAAILGCHQPLPAFVQQPPDDGRFAPFENIEHVALGAPLAVITNDAYAHTITMQDGAHFLWRDVNSGFAVGAQHEAVAVAVAVNHALKFAHQCHAGEGPRAADCFVLDDRIPRS